MVLGIQSCIRKLQKFVILMQFWSLNKKTTSNNFRLKPCGFAKIKQM
jgi:hypothetical protein